MATRIGFHPPSPPTRPAELVTGDAHANETDQSARLVRVVVDPKRYTLVRRVRRGHVFVETYAARSTGHG